MFHCGTLSVNLLAHMEETKKKRKVGPFISMGDINTSGAGEVITYKTGLSRLRQTM